MSRKKCDFFKYKKCEFYTNMHIYPHKKCKIYTYTWPTLSTYVERNHQGIQKPMVFQIYIWKENKNSSRVPYHISWCNIIDKPLPWWIFFEEISLSIFVVRHYGLFFIFFHKFVERKNFQYIYMIFFHTFFERKNF